MNSQKNYYIRLDKKGNRVPGSGILRNKKPVTGRWVEDVLNPCCIPTPPSEPALRLVFDDIANVPVADASSVSDWNTFFDLPTNGTPFTSVEVTGNEVALIGGSSITLADYLFSGNHNLLQIVDDASSIVAVSEGSCYSCDFLNKCFLPVCNDIGIVSFFGCVVLADILFPLVSAIGDESFENCYLLPDYTWLSLVTIGEAAFGSCNNFINPSFPVATTLGISSFNNVTSLVNPSFPNVITLGEEVFGGVSSALVADFPSVTTVGDNLFYNVINLGNVSFPSCTSLGSSVTDNGVFFGVSGQVITLTVPLALMTCNAGSPDGDIQYLQANNTVTIITV